MLDLPLEVAQQWQPLISITGDVQLFQSRYRESNSNNAIQFLTFDTSYPNSIISCLQSARENARSIREIISSEMWEEVNSFYLMVKDISSTQSLDELPPFFNSIKMASHRFAGVMDATMTHNEGWHFGQMGRFLERADKTTRLLDVKYFLLLPSAEWVGTSLDQIQWMSLLKSTSAYEMYRKCQRRITPSYVAQFLILDRYFPRSIYFCVRQAEACLHEITNTSRGTWCNSAEKSLGKLCSELNYLTIEEVIQDGLHEFLDRMQSDLNNVGNEIYNTFFALENSPSAISNFSSNNLQLQSSSVTQTSSH
jgi:uncharacterized alpha-E superfamily protein